MSHSPALPLTDAADASPSFSARLREDTKAVHREAERTGFVADLIRGRATRAGYALYLRNLVPVYATLETGLDLPDRAPWMAAFADPALRRLPALLADVEACGGRAWCKSCPLLPEAESYAEAVESAARGDGTRLAAHAYARYLGDLSGGQILRPLLARHLDLGDEMLRFYDFPAIDDLETSKAAMRAALDHAPVDCRDAIVAEAVGAFRHTIAMSLAVARAAAAEAVVD